MGKPLLFLAAGDVSGDNAAGRVVAALIRQRPDLEVFGLGGSRLKSLGQEQLAEPGRLTVLGFWEVAKRYPFFRRLFYRCVDEIKARRPSCVLLVDYPGFNLRLARKVKALGIPVVYYISPQVWAWGKRRMAAIRKYVDFMLLILPFEESFYVKSGVPTRFVGHYLLEDIPREYIQSRPVHERQIALLPGSRPQEIERMLPGMLKAAGHLHRRHGTSAVVAGIRGACDYERLLQRDGDGGVTVCYDDPRTVLYESGLVLTASGTATLEAGIIGRPMVIVYRTGFITYHIARRLVKLDMIGLVNLVLGEKVVPELVQGAATPERMAVELERLLTDDACRSGVCANLNRLPALLGGEGASQRVAEIVGSYI
ncbi:MAG TPA: lipid-A-disaccharide synthase [Acidobacteriota bacterium]|nr:lipid-A-disaccharide synthase [Acidobacteriota bacterium]